MEFPRHEHAEHPDGDIFSGEPVDGILWAHIVIMAVTFGIIFPTGLVCGLAKHRLHVPIQITGGVLATVGYILGHSHGGRTFDADNIHSKFATWMLFIVAGQLGLGVLLKLHINKGFLGRVRQVLAKCHLVIGCLFPILSWVQMGFGAIALPGFCYADHLGQCIAHGIMGSSFVLYGVVLLIMLYVGENFLIRRNRSQEFYDSTIITLWGIVNTFTEHRWGKPWSHEDYQHTSMGIIWWCAGMVGIYLSWDRTLNQPRRNLVPAMVMMFTGYAMSQHSQRLEVSAKVHYMFGMALIGAGLVRLIEISFVLHDQPHRGPVIKTFQFLPPFLLVESGMLFMSANEEQMQLLNKIGVMHASYILVISSIAFLLFLLFLFLINLYMVMVQGKDASSTHVHEPLAQSPPPPFTPGPGIEMRSFLNEDDEEDIGDD